MLESQTHIAILGCAGVPARYGGFETLAEQLARHHARHRRPEKLTIACSTRNAPERPRRFAEAELCYVPLSANGASSVPYDAISLARARASGADVALLLGVSGAMILPFLARGKMRVIVHIDGREWQRAKWTGPAKRILRICEALALRHADTVIADSPAIADELRRRYGRQAETLTYGGDQALAAPVAALPDWAPQRYALAICRIEPENNVHLLLEACSASGMPLICVGNWDHSRYGRVLRSRFASHPNLHLHDPIYDAAPLQVLRRNASLYLHGHSAGGTNPSLVEMMHTGQPVFAYDCIFNRQTTGNAAQYFRTARDLAGLLRQGAPAGMGAALQRLAQANYCWDDVGAGYFDLFERVARAPRRTLQGSTASTRATLGRRFFMPRY